MLFSIIPTNEKRKANQGLEEKEDISPKREKHCTAAKCCFIKEDVNSLD